jgi:outer membrane biosynthesis protein TonB
LDVVVDEQGSDVSVIRLTIDERGRVEHVRLLSPGSSFNDRMSLAAAKAWVFRPARLVDRPVKYQLDVRLRP